MTAHIVAAPAVQVVAAGRAHFIEEGGYLPGGVDGIVIDRLTREGLIFEVPSLEELAALAEEERIAAEVEAEAERERAARADEAKFNAAVNTAAEKLLADRAAAAKKVASTPTGTPAKTAAAKPAAE